MVIFLYIYIGILIFIEIDLILMYRLQSHNHHKMGDQWMLFNLILFSRGRENVLKPLFHV